MTRAYELFLNTSKYPEAGSAIVALIVLEHQVSMQNIFTHLNFEARRHLSRRLWQVLSGRIIQTTGGQCRPRPGDRSEKSFSTARSTCLLTGGH